MRQWEIRDCMRIYRDSVDAYCALINRLDAAHEAMTGMPLLRSTRFSLREAEADLDRLGEALAVVPELVENLEEEVRLGDSLREQAARAGLVFRYGLEEPPPEPVVDDDDDDDFGDDDDEE